MKLIKDKKSKTGTISLPEKAVREESSALMKMVQDLIGDGYKTVVFDFTNTTMIDSATLGVLIHLKRQLVEKDVVHTLKGVSGYVKTVLDNAKISALFSQEEPTESGS